MLSQTEELIDEIRRGRMVVLVDDDTPDSHGELVMAAAAVRPEDVNFFARHVRGLICLTLTAERCRRLQLPLMAHDALGDHGTRFTVSIEAAHGVSTGISAADRAHTIRTAVAPGAKPSDLVQPGHVFPLMAQPGGVLSRAGHTEAGCDLARLAGMEPAAVTVEALTEDGAIARREDLTRLAAQHGLKMGSIADLIRFRVEHERTIERREESQLATEFGLFRLVVFQDVIAQDVHLALVKGEIRPEVPALVRVHVHNPLCDLTGTLRVDCGWPLRDALESVGAAPCGVVVILTNQIRPEDLLARVRSFREPASPPVEGPRDPNVDELRRIGLGGQILAELGVRKMRVLSVPRKIHALAGFGLEIVEYVSELGSAARGRVN